MVFMRLLFVGIALFGFVNVPAANKELVTPSRGSQASEAAARQAKCASLQKVAEQGIVRSRLARLAGLLAKISDSAVREAVKSKIDALDSEAKDYFVQAEALIVEAQKKPQTAKRAAARSRSASVQARTHQSQKAQTPPRKSSSPEGARIEVPILSTPQAGRNAPPVHLAQPLSQNHDASQESLTPSQQRALEAKKLVAGAQKRRIEAAFEELDAQAQRGVDKGKCDSASFLNRPANQFALASGAAGLFSLSLAFKLVYDKYLAEQRLIKKNGQKIDFKWYVVKQFFGTIDPKEAQTYLKILGVLLLGASPLCMATL